MVAFVATASAISPNNTSNLSLTCALPSTTVGHFNMISISGYSGGIDVNPEMSTPSGWFKLGEKMDDQGNPNVWCAMYYRFYQAGDSASITFNWVNPGQMGVQATAYSNVNTIIPISDFAFNYKPGTTGVNTASITLNTTQPGWTYYGLAVRNGGAWSATTDTIRGTLTNTSALSFVVQDSNGEVAAGSYTKSATFGGTATSNIVEWAANIVSSSTTVYNLQVR